MMNRAGSPIQRAVALSCALLFPVSLVSLAQQPAGPPPVSPATQQAAPLLSPDQLNNLVAPVALYPDPLLGQVLAASTYPLEIVEAQQWLQKNGNLTGAQLMDAARQQNWDPSVQALVAFPDALSAVKQRYSLDYRPGERIPGPAVRCDERGAGNESPRPGERPADEHAAAGGDHGHSRRPKRD